MQDDNTFIWLRGFENAEDRDRKKEAFCGGDLWLERLEEEAFSMVEGFSNVLLVEPTANSELK